MKPFITTKSDAKTLRKLMRKHPLILIRDLKPLERDHFLNLAKELGDLLEWDFGPVMELEVKDQAENYLFSREEVPLHWDGAFHQEPRWLFFNCITAPLPESGGETFFVDTHLVWKQAGEIEQALWENTFLMYETQKVAHYGGKIVVKMCQKHPAHDYPILRYAEPVNTQLNPVHLSILNCEDPQQFIEDMKKRLYQPTVQYQHTWKSGDLLIADNFQLLHGRTAFSNISPRHLRRIQILRPKIEKQSQKRYA
jgi:alpha-ketoglutarate-dependent taurine dioxygenase